MPLLRKQAAVQAKICCSQDKGQIDTMFEASIKTKEKFETIKKLFSTEDKELKRSSYKITKLKDGSVQFDIKADDIAALRATLNSITQILSVYKKMEDFAEND